MRIARILWRRVSLELPYAFAWLTDRSGRRPTVRIQLPPPPRRPNLAHFGELIENPCVGARIAPRFSEEQIIEVLREAEAEGKVSELCRRHGISDATFYTWRSKYGELEISEMHPLWQ